jgi:hypothetical protein
MKKRKKEFASPGDSVIPGTLWVKTCASTEAFSLKPKIRIITIGLLRDLSEIKLKRTDTTLDLSPVDEKENQLACVSMSVLGSC